MAWGIEPRLALDKKTHTDLRSSGVGLSGGSIPGTTAIGRQYLKFEVWSTRSTASSLGAAHPSARRQVITVYPVVEGAGGSKAPDCWFLICYKLYQRCGVQVTFTSKGLLKLQGVTKDDVNCYPEGVAGSLVKALYLPPSTVGQLTYYHSTPAFRRQR